MANSTSSTRLIEWSLGAFHTSLFFWLFVVVLYLTGTLGNLLASLNTIVGMIVFVFLWVITWFWTRLVVWQIVDTADWGATKIPLGKALVLAILGGGVNGLFFFLISLFVAAIIAVMAVIASRSLTDVPALLVLFGYSFTIGSALSFVIGAVFGFLFALLDLLLLGASQFLFALNGGTTKDERKGEG